MKRIALVTTSLNEEQTLKPFICTLEQDPHVDLGRISWTGHSDARMDLKYLRVETDNILLDNQFHLTLDRQEKFAATSQDFNLQLIFQRALTALSPELVIVFGNSPMAFAAASAAPWASLPATSTCTSPPICEAAESALAVCSERDALSCSARRRMLMIVSPFLKARRLRS